MRNLLVTLTLLALGLGAAFLIASPGAGARTAVDGTLTGVVGSQATPDAYSIGLSAQTVAPGTYELDVTDYSTIHNFRFCTKGTATTCAAGPVNVATTIEGTGSTSFVVTLTPGTYLYRCDAHSVMRGTLVVSDPNSTTTSTTPALSLKIVGTKATRKVVTVKVKTNIGAHITASLLDKSSTDLADAAADGTTATLKLKPAQTLTKGKYTLLVTADDGTATVTKQKKVTVM